MTPGKSLAVLARRVAIKAGIFVGSLVFLLFLLEMVLRLTGVVFHHSREHVFNTQYREPQVFELHGRVAGRGGPSPTIVCIGDSFTNGGQVDDVDSYPAKLFEMLEKDPDGPKFNVLNMGKCEDNTAGVYERLRDFVHSARDRYDPEIVVVLAGAADKFNRWGLEDALRPVTWVQTLRIYKMYRHIVTALYMAAHARHLRTSERDAYVIKPVRAGDPGTGGMLRHRPETHLSGRELREHNATRIELYERFYKQLKAVTALQRAGKEGEAGRALDRLLVQLRPHLVEGSTPYACVGSVAFQLVPLYCVQGRHDDAFGFLLDVAATYPGVWLVESGGGIAHMVRYELVQVYQLQSKYDAQDVLDVLGQSLSANPWLAESRHFLVYRNLMEKWQETDAVVAKNRLRIWDDLVAMCRKSGIRLIVQNYPTDYGAANAALRQVAAKYGLPFIDNHTLFSGLTAGENRARYLFDDDHSTPEGCRIMAEQVARAVRQIHAENR